MSNVGMSRSGDEGDMQMEPWGVNKEGKLQFRGTDHQIMALSEVGIFSRFKKDTPITEKHIREVAKQLNDKWKEGKQNGTLTIAIEGGKRFEVTIPHDAAKTTKVWKDTMPFKPPADTSKIRLGQARPPLALAAAKKETKVKQPAAAAALSGTGVIVEQVMSGSTTKQQSNEVLYPSSAETKSSKDVEKLFAHVKKRDRTNQDFVGQWIPYYSVEDGQVVVTRCIGEGTYEKLKEINVGQKNKNISQVTREELFAALGPEKELDKLRQYHDFSFEGAFRAPEMPFRPRLRVVIDDAKAFSEFKSKWNASGLKDNVRVCFDEANCMVYFPYSSKELLALSNSFPFLKKLVQNDLRAAEEFSAAFKNADTFFETLSPTLVELDLPVDDPAKLVIKMLEDRKFPGVLIGEGHSDKNPKAMLIESMKSLKEAGVKTLFLEHLFFDTLQPDVDHYFSLDPGAKMPAMLEAYLDYLDRGFHIGKDDPNGFKALVKAAHDNRIRVVGIDTSTSYAAGRTAFGNEGPDRIKVMNYEANRIIAEEAKGGKYVALMGSMHVSTSEKVPGLSEILGCPNIVFIKNTEDDSRSIEAGVKNLLPQGFNENRVKIMGGNVNFLVKIP